MALLRPCRRLVQAFGKLPVSCQFDYVQCIERVTRTQGYVTFSPKLCNSKINSENLEFSTINNSTSDVTWSHRTIDDLQRKLATLCFSVKNGRFQNEDLLRILENYTSSKDTIEQSAGLIVLRNCGNALPHVNSNVRQILTNQTWDIIRRDSAALTLEHYNTLLGVHLQNNQPVESKNFLDNMIVKPDETTYKLLLQVAARHGDVESAFNILTEMEIRELAMNEEIFNLLILTYASNKNINAALSVLEKMKDAKIEPSLETYGNIACGYASIGDYQNTIKILKNYSLNFTQIMEIIKRLSSSNLGGHIPDVLKNTTLPVSLDDTIILDTLTELTYNGRPEDAFEVINCLAPAASDGQTNNIFDGFLKNMIRAKIPNDTVLKFMNTIMTVKNYPLAIMDVCEGALHAGERELAMLAFEIMHEKKIAVRPHYYWPLLISASRNHGESEIFHTLKHMIRLNVQLDHDTIYMHVLSYINTTEPLVTLQKLCDIGLRISVVLTPLICYLLNEGRMKEAATLCSTLKAPIDFETVLKPLVIAYKTSKSMKDCVNIFKYVQPENHYSEKFLLTLFGKRPDTNNAILLNEFLRAFKDAGITVSEFTYVENRKEDKDGDSLDTLISSLDFIRPRTEIPHPRNMNIQELECHLIELKSKRKNTRGVLRRLLQKHCKENNAARAEEIKNEYDQKSFTWTPGMYSSLLHLYVNNGRIEDAMNLYSKIQDYKEHKLDDFKVLNLATALVNDNRINEAFEVVESATSVGGSKISKDCWRLLDAMAHSSSYELTESMLQVLVKRGYCDRTNTMLGPLIRVHLLREDLVAAVDTYKKCAERYGVTPLRQELVYALVKSRNENATTKTETFKLLEDVQSITKKIQGQFQAIMDYLIALARYEVIDELRNILQHNSIPDVALDENLKHVPKEIQLTVLTTLLNASAGSPRINRGFIYKRILSLHSRTGDCEQAIELWKKLSEDNDVVMSQEFVTLFVNLLTKHKVPLPKSFSHTRFDQ